MIFKYDKENGFGVNDIFTTKKLSPTEDRGNLQATIDLFNEEKLSADALNEAVGGIDEAMLSYLRTCKNGEAHMVGFDKHVIKTNKSIGLTGIKSKAAAIGVGLLNTALSMGISLLAGLIIEGVITFFDNIIHRSEKIAEAAQEAREEIDGIKSSFDELESTTNGIKKRFAELAQGVDLLTNKNLTLSTDDYNEFLGLSNQLAELFPTLTKNYDDNGNAILDLSGDVGSIVSSLDELIKKQRQLANEEILEKLPTVYKGYENNVDEYSKKLEEAKKRQEDYTSLYNQLKNAEYDVSDDKKTVTFHFGNISEEDKSKLEQELTSSFEDINDYITQDFGTLDNHDSTITLYLDKEFGGFEARLKSAQEDISKYASKIESETSSFSNYMNTWLQDSWEFQQIDDDKMQQALKQVLFNKDWIKLAKDALGDDAEWEDISSWIEKNYIKAINGIEDDEIKQSFIDLFNTPDLTPQAAIELAEKIQDYFKKHNINVSLDFILDEGDPSSTQNLVNRFDKSIKDVSIYDPKGYYKLEDFTKNFNEVQMATWLSVTQGIIGADEAIARYNEEVGKANQYSGFFTEENNSLIDNYMSKVNTLAEYYNKLHTSEGLSSEDKAELATSYKIAENSTEGYKQAILREISSMENESAIIIAIKNAIENCTDAKEKLMLETLLDSMTNVDNEAITAAKGFDTLGNAMSTLQSRAELLRDIHKDINKFGKIDVSGLNAILSAYPELEEKVSLYNAGLITEAELFNELKKAYATDKQNYINLMSTKLQFDEAFYDGITEKIPNWLKELANSYGIDFKNFKNLCDLKLAAQKELVKKQLQLEAARTVMNTIIAKKTPSDDPTERVAYTDSGSEQNGTGSVQSFNGAKQQYLDLLKIIEGIDELVGTGLDLDWEEYGIDSDTLTKIDWADQALSVLQEAVDDAQTALENTDGFQAQLDAIDTLNDALGDLKEGYETAKGEYETRYTNGLNKLSNKKEIKQKIESGEEFDLAQYKPEEAEIIQELIDLYAKIKEAENKIAELSTQIYDNENFEKSKIRQADLESQLDVVDEKLNDTTLSTKDKIDLLEQRYELQKSINDELRIQAELEGNTEKVKQLDEQDKNNEYQKNSDIYDTNKEDVLRNVSKNDNEITDIQNDIDLAGHGTVEQYDKIITLQEANIGEWERQKQVAYDMREANKDNAALYEYWDNELQDCEDNIHSMNSGIKEMQQAILNLPLQEVEEKLQSINKELDSRNRELDEQSELINAAIAVYDEQIEIQNEIKEGIQERIDALQEEHDLREANLNVQKAQYELEKAKNNKTTKVFREGQGFVFEADQDAVQEAQLNYDNSVYERKIQLLNEEIKKVDKNIDSLNKQKKQWEDIIPLMERAALITKAEAYDMDFKNKVLSGNVALLTTIKDKYGEIYSSIGTLEESKEPYELLQEELTDIAQQHSLSAISYEEALAQTMSALQQYYPELLKKYEQEGTSLEEVAKKQLEGVGVTEETSEDNLEVVKGTNEEITQSYKNMLTELEDVFEQLNTILTTFANNAALMASSVASSVAAISSAISSVGSIDVDIDNVDNKNNDLKDAYTKVDNSISEMYKDIADKLNASIVQNIKPATTTSVTVPNTTNNKTTSISFGDINVTGVQNATDFAKAIVSSLPSAMKQELYK